MKQQVWVLCGLIGSGKSTWAKAALKSKPNTIVVCKDALRYMIYGCEYKFNMGDEPFVNKLAKRAIKNGGLLTVFQEE